MKNKDIQSKNQTNAFLETGAYIVVVVVCPCRSNAEHRGLLSEVSMVMCVDVVSDQPTDCQSHLAGSQETWVRNGR